MSPLRHIFALLVLTSGLAFGTPPTVDPTYGLPLPTKPSASEPLPRDAHWIWASSTRDNQTIYVRRTFDLSNRGAVTVYVTADDFFTLYVNGREVGGTAPDPNDGSVWAHVRSFDITLLVTGGDNEIAIKSVNAFGAAGILCRVEVEGHPVLLSDNSWRVTERQPSQEWTNLGFDDSNWQNARDLGAISTLPWGSGLSGWPVPIGAEPGYLSHLQIRPVQVSYAQDIDHLSWSSAARQLSISRPARSHGDWRLILDFGKELTGRIVVNGYSGSLKIGTGESAGEAIEKPYVSSTRQHPTRRSGMQW
jgi:hypothetical protein